MTTIEFEIWQKIKNFQFDKPNVKLTFAKRLARENNFTDSFTKQIIEEYRKFIFLCCISKHQITPSHFVDLAWHLHLTYTKSYWIELCQNTICKEIHHNPTEGGGTENIKFKNYYNKTLRLYKSKFNKNPPMNIWQNDVQRFENRTVNVDKNKNWIILKPVFIDLKPNFRLLSFLIILSTLLFGCNQDSNFVFSIFGFFVLFVIIVSIASSKLNRNNNSDSTTSSGCGSGSEGYIYGSETFDSNDGGDSSDEGDSGCGGGCGGGD